MKKQIALAVITAAGFLLTGCLVDEIDTTPTPVKEKSLVIYETDYVSGHLAVIDSNDDYASLVSPVHKDAVLYCTQTSIYLLEAWGMENIMSVDPVTGVINYQEHLGENINLADIKIVSDTKAIVSCKNAPYLIIVNPITGDSTGSIDISEFAYPGDDTTEAESTPYPNGMVLDGDYLYVVLERRNGWVPGAKTMVLKINAATNAIVDSILLDYTNGGVITKVENALYVACNESAYSYTDGALQKIDLNSYAVSTAFTEAQFERAVMALYPGNGDTAYLRLQYYDAADNYSESTIMVRVDLSTNTVLDTLDEVGVAGPALYDATSGKLYMGERSLESGAGVHIWKNGVYQEKIATTIFPDEFGFIN